MRLDAIAKNLLQPQDAMIIFKNTFIKMVFETSFGLSLILVAFFAWPKLSDAATLSVTPATGTYTVGNTFSVSLLLNTEGQTVNAVEASISFPPDKLQLVSGAAGTSVIEIYTIPPRINNQGGRLDIAGGIPGGLNVRSGQVTTMTFRVKAVGSANIRVLDNSKVLLNDGQGTNVLGNTGSATYTLELPPPNGPKVTSETHPNPELWYSAQSAILSWEKETDVEGYSYTLSTDPVDLPQDIVQSKQSSVIYKSLSDGVQYFHIKALRKGVWGGTTHYSLKIDSTPPASFPISISPSPRTNSRRPFIEFITTDSLSGLGRYELKIVPLGGKLESEPLFVEATSPYPAPELSLGNYEVIVRVYDKAGNFRDITQRLEISDSVYRYFGGGGLQLTKKITVSWYLIGLLGLLVLLGLIILALWVRRWAGRFRIHASNEHLPTNLKDQLTELNKYRQRYGKLAALFLACLISLSVGQHTSHAAELEFSPPVITSHSTSISEEEIFFVAGRTSEPNTAVVIHLQNLYDGQTFNFESLSDKRGDWFYRHTGFLSGGQYLIWAQGKSGEQLSAPSPQVTMSVQPIAFRIGSSRVPYNMLYLVAIISLFVLVLLLVVFIILHAHIGRRRKKEFMAHVRTAEESIKRGFALLRKDIEAELKVVKKASLSPELSAEERIREQEILDDLQAIEKYVDKEIWEVETFEGSPST